jgi:hypothetical protein
MADLGERLKKFPSFPLNHKSLVDVMTETRTIVMNGSLRLLISAHLNIMMCERQEGISMYKVAIFAFVFSSFLSTDAEAQQKSQKEVMKFSTDNRYKGKYPVKSDFDQNIVKDKSGKWNQSRKPGSGGGDKGDSFVVDEGFVLVEYETSPTSDINTEGNGNRQVIFYDPDAATKVPKGVVVGIRLEPGGIGGAGASYTGDVRMWFVPLAEWEKVFKDKYFKIKL